MNALRRLSIMVGFHLVPVLGSSHAADYWVDFATGSDANAGTSSASPWKRNPFQNGFAGAYSYSSGDRFIHRGGVTWPVTAFQMRVTQPNVSFLSTNTWGTGRAVFDFENTSLGSGTANYGIYITASAPSMIFANLDIKRHRNENSHGSSTINVAFSGSGSVTFTNCVIRDWSIPTPLPPNVGAGNVGGGIWWTAGAGLVIVDHCDLHQENVANKSGRALQAVNVVQYSSIHHCGTGWTGGGTVRYNSFYNLGGTLADPTAHLAAIKTFVVSDIYGNKVYDLLSGEVAGIELSCGYGSSSGQTKVYNNVVWDTPVQPSIWAKSDTSSYANISYILANNTIYRGGGYCVRFYNDGGANFQAVSLLNNHFITEGTPVELTGITAYTHSNNLTNTVAQGTAYGYTEGNEFAPTGSASPTVEQGLNLSAYFTTDIAGSARTVPWDIGAYEWADTPGALGTAVLSASSYSVGEEDGFVTITANRVSGSTGVLSVNYSQSDGTAVDGVNYTATTGSFSWANGDITSKSVNVPIIDANSSGNPTFTFTITGDVSAPSSAVVTITGSGSPSTPILSGLSWPATDGELSAPFVLDIDQVYQTDDTQGSPDLGGTLTFSFVPAVSGTYSGSVISKALFTYQNSIYFNLNTNPPVDPDTIFDVPISADFTTNTVSWRGTGGLDTPEFPVATWLLQSGTTNTVYIRGREPYTRIKHVTLTLLDEPETPIPVIYTVSSAASGYYKAGGVIPIQVGFTTNVTVTGTPQLTLNTGAVVDYTSGSGSNVLTFTYTVGAGENTQSLDYASTNSLALNGGTIKNAGTDATLALPVPGEAGSISYSKTVVVDTTPPVLVIGSPVPSIATVTNVLTFSIAYSDLNFNTSTLSTGNITKGTSGTANGVLSVNTSGQTALVQFTNISGNGDLWIDSIAAGTASDLAGNLAEAAGSSAHARVISYVITIISAGTISDGILGK